MHAVRSGQRAAAGLVASAALACAFGCAGLIGLGDLERVDDLDGSIVPTFEGGDGPIFGDGGSCVPTGPEVCDDGIDNDCNGRVDCADPACASTGFACTPSVPAGWLVVAFNATQRVACPAGYPTPTDLTAAPANPGSCACNCTTVGNTCSASPFSVAVGPSNTCTGSSATGLVADGGCNPVSGLTGINPNAYLQANAPAGPTSCTPNPSNTLGATRNGRSCEGTKTGGGCTVGVCARSPGTPFSSCIQRAGQQSCPAGYPNRTIVGLTATDTRGCTPCSCANVPCLVNVAIFNSGNCGGASDMAGLTNGQCILQSNGNFNAANYVATVLDGGCRPTAPSVPEGGLALQSESTICCR